MRFAIYAHICNILYWFPLLSLLALLPPMNPLVVFVARTNPDEPSLCIAADVGWHIVGIADAVNHNPSLAFAARPQSLHSST